MALKGFKLSQMSHAIIGMAQWSKLTRCTILDASSVKLLAVLIGPTNKGKGTVKSYVLSNFKGKGQNWDLNPGLHLLDKYFIPSLNLGWGRGRREGLVFSLTSLKPDDLELATLPSPGIKGMHHYPVFMCCCCLDPGYCALLGKSYTS